MSTIKKKFEIGDQVIWDATKNGLTGQHKGRVIHTDLHNALYQVYVDFGKGLHEWFTADGRWAIEHEPSLTHAEPGWEATITEGRLEARMPGKPGKVVISRESDGSICVRVYAKNGSTLGTDYYLQSDLEGES